MWHHMPFSHCWSQHWWPYWSFLHGIVLWLYQYNQRAAYEIGSLKASGLKSRYANALLSSPTSSSLNCLVSVQACKDFLVAQLREWWGTRTSLALLWVKKTCGTAPPVLIQQGAVARACLKCMNTLTDVNWSTWSLWVKHMPKCFSGLEILPFLCKSVCKYLQAGMLVF